VKVLESQERTREEIGGHNMALQERDEQQNHTNKTLMQEIFNILESMPDFEKAKKIMNCMIPESVHVEKLTNHKFDVIAIPSFSALESDGIYVDCYVSGTYEAYGEDRTLKAGMLKTLGNSLEDMKIMGELCGIIGYVAKEYIDKNIHFFQPDISLDVESGPYGLEITRQEPKIRNGRKEQCQESGAKAEKPFVPHSGQRVIFQPHEGAARLTGEVVEADENTVTLQCGRAKIPVFREKGTFMEAPEPERNETKKYALEQAQKYVREKGKVFFAHGGECFYRGIIVELTPTFAIQKVGEKAILHRLKDLENIDKRLIQPGQEIGIYKNRAGEILVDPCNRKQAVWSQGENGGQSR
jgi:hypothetical protein